MNKKVLAVAVSSALATPMAAHAVKYKLSGQVNRAIAYQDDGAATDVQFFDNQASGTRWRMTGSEDIGQGMKVGFNWEWQVSPNAGTAPIKSGDGPGSGSQNMRKAEVWFSGNWGKVSLGKGDGAGNGGTEVDLSDTWNVNYVVRSSYGGSTPLRTSGSGNPPLTSGGVALTMGGTFNSFDAFSRYDRIRYDSPALGPVTVAASVGQNHTWEGAVRLASGIAGGQLSAALFYGETSGVDNRYGGSASYLFSQGTNVTVSYSANEFETSAGQQSPDGTNWYVKVGHKWGNNSVSVGYGVCEECVSVATANAAASSDWENSGFNIGFNHNIPKAQVDLYAGYNMAEVDTPSGVPGVEDVSAFVVGTKLKFD